MTCLLFIMTYWFHLSESSKTLKKHVHNSLLPVVDGPSYNISSWVKQLHLQQCVIVETGMNEYAIFTEYRTDSTNTNEATEEYFLGICDIQTLRHWKFCSPELEKERPDDCVFHEHPELYQQSRVHRRLCDISHLVLYGKLCDCSSRKNLHRVTGFPTCFQPPLPDSLCTPRNVCGTFSCNASTVNNKIHTVKCNPNCKGQQPFCETKGADTTRPARIYSYWSDWSSPLCYDGTSTCQYGLMYSRSICVNQFTKLGAIDCLGPGTSCCPPGLDRCSCHVYAEDGVSKLFRLFSVTRNGTTRRKRDVRYSKRQENALLEIKQILRGKDVRKKDVVEEEEEDDDEDENEDEGSDDIELEEDTEESEARSSTVEGKERDEVWKEVRTIGSVMPEMAEDLNQAAKSRGVVHFSNYHTELIFLNLFIAYF